MKADYAMLWTLLGDGTASRKAAEAIVAMVK